MGRGVDCSRCGASTPLPDDLRQPTFRCGACGAELSTAAFAGASAVSADALVGHVRAAVAGRADPAATPRFDGGGSGGPGAFDPAGQIAGNQALARLRAEGVRCGGCGGLNPVPDDGSVQVVCRFCGAAVLLADHVDPAAVGRDRLKHGIFAFRDEVIRQQEARDRLVRNVILAAVGVIVLAIVAAALLR